MQDKNKKIYWSLPAACLALSIIVGGSCQHQDYHQYQEYIDMPAGENIPSLQLEGPDKDHPGIEKTFCYPRCSYCGKTLEEYEDKLPRPFAVALDNPSGTSQPGLQAACLVYELAKGEGQTRYLAFYDHPFQGDIGPVANAWKNLVELAGEHRALLVHSGQTQLARQEMYNQQVHNLDQEAYPHHFWSSPGGEPSHHLYSDLEKMLEGCRELGLSGETIMSSFLSFDQELTFDNPKDFQVEITHGPRYRVTYNYDQETSSYSRFIDGQGHIDENTGEIIRVKTLLMQYTEAPVTLEKDTTAGSEGYQDIPLEGTGRAILVTKGHLYRLKWEKRDPGSLTRFYFENGKKIVLPPGNVWIHLVSPDTKINVNLKNESQDSLHDNRLLYDGNEENNSDSS